MTALQFLTALGLTESDGNPNVKPGDSGQAMGRFQVHPAWVWDMTDDGRMKPGLAETWDQWVGRMVVAFFDAHNYLPPVEIAMWFHLGHRTMPTDTDWDTSYASRFNARASASA